MQTANRFRSIHWNQFFFPHSVLFHLSFKLTFRCPFRLSLFKYDCDFVFENWKLRNCLKKKTSLWAFTISLINLVVFNQFKWLIIQTLCFQLKETKDSGPNFCCFLFALYWSQFFKLLSKKLWYFYALENKTPVL